jgi:hypothetical protein
VRRVVFPNQNAIETPAAGIVHQCPVCAVVLAFGPASFQVAADAIDVLLIYGEAAPGSVFAQGEQLRLRVLFTGGDTRVYGNQGWLRRGRGILVQFWRVRSRRTVAEQSRNSHFPDGRKPRKVGVHKTCSARSDLFTNLQYLRTHLPCEVRTVSYGHAPVSGIIHGSSIWGDPTDATRGRST